MRYTVPWKSLKVFMPGHNAFVSRYAMESHCHWHWIHSCKSHAKSGELSCFPSIQHVSMSNCLFLQGACHTLSYFVTLWDFLIWLEKHMNSYDSYDSMCVLLSIPLPQVLRDMSTSQEDWSVGVYAFYVFAFLISFCIFLFFVGLWTSLAVSNVQRWGCEPRIAE